MNKFFAAFALATLAATTTASAQDEGTPTLLGGTGLEQGTLIAGGVAGAVILGVILNDDDETSTSTTTTN
ncbi:hypothetical protein D1820_18375 (plasmid) [Phaeobacter sp. LSS9]|uniref:Uncharacterized protein n=1 Tax=Phaeobacter piscinae TaxID=1580596 RepID=A0AAN1LCR9_9RHOB|nr:MULTISPECIES: hypothetical protein [Phaeobacter]ATG45992.1 hypothetical protein PhaeoP13_04110 [Phaeobacter piscinae]AUQ76724.1 hypothetical protein PhaeoP71_03904 [Phaeobacter piscinae]AUR38315.1 hypothetical protein PhaeoP18_04099 [Phaeobacter piscinae]AXT37063.1 hypothetical protein D1820_18375 [Phaeobacter sp. LSS9]